MTQIYAVVWRPINQRSYSYTVDIAASITECEFFMLESMVDNVTVKPDSIKINNFDNGYVATTQIDGVEYDIPAFANFSLPLDNVPKTITITKPSGSYPIKVIFYGSSKGK